MFGVDLKMFLDLISPNQYCHAVVRENQAMFFEKYFRLQATLTPLLSFYTVHINMAIRGASGV